MAATMDSYWGPLYCVRTLIVPLRITVLCLKFHDSLIHEKLNIIIIIIYLFICLIKINREE